MEENFKIIRCMILSDSQQTCETFSKYLFNGESKNGFYGITYKNHEFKAFCKWPNSPKGLPELPAVDVLIIRVHNEKEWIDLHDFVRERALIHFKIIVWDSEIKILLEDCKPNILCKLNDKKPNELFDAIIKSEKEVEDLLFKVFKNFDKNGDGYIDVSEIESMCRELGLDTTKADFQETVHCLDINNDNKISFEELCDWWKQGRQNSKLMETLITMRLATSSFLSNISDQTYLNSLKDKIQLVELEKKELVNSFISVNVEKVTMHPEAFISIDSYFGGEKKETMSKSYCQYYEEGLKSSHYFLILEFEVRDSKTIDAMVKTLSVLVNTLRSSLKYLSRNFAEFINNELSIMVIKKNEKTICLSIKMKHKRKEQLTNLETMMKGFLDDTITQNISLSFTLSGEIEKVKQNPNAIFIDTFNPAASLEIKSEILKKNIQLLLQLADSMPRSLKFWLHSYSGSRVELNFTLDYIKTLKNSFMNESCKEILNFIKVNLFNLIKESLASFGGFGQFKKFYDDIKENISFVLNTPQAYVIMKVGINDIKTLLE